jgi:hypothetical protein
MVSKSCHPSWHSQWRSYRPRRLDRTIIDAARRILTGSASKLHELQYQDPLEQDVLLKMGRLDASSDITSLHVMILEKPAGHLGSSTEGFEHWRRAMKNRYG